jgi:signal transduction histidine kinase
MLARSTCIELGSMADLPRTTDAAASVLAAQAHTHDAESRGGPRGRFYRALWNEPWWLRGVTWPLVGIIVALAVMENMPQMLRAVVPRHRDPGVSWQFAAFDLSVQLAVGVTIMLVASALLNMRRPRVPIVVALIVAVAVGTVVPINGAAYLMHGRDGGFLFSMAIARRVAIPWAIAAAAWYFLRRSNARQDALRAAEVVRRRLETGVIEAHLQSLEAQVEPHFLFNTLAHVRRLYRTDPLRARLMLDSFRGYLQSALPQMRGRATTLGHELDLVRAYLDVQRVRMDRRLTVRFDVPIALRERTMPRMMLLTLVENSIKHGLNPVPGGGIIEITARQGSGAVEVCVADTGRGIGEMIGSGTGLANIRSRLAALYGPAGRLVLTSNVPHGVRATLSLPHADGRPQREAAQAVIGELS